VSALTLDPGTTALVLIDLQENIVGLPVAPHPGPEVVANARKMADRFREKGMPVVLVRVAFADEKERLTPPVDTPPPGRPGRGELVAELGRQPGDIVITKHQWGAFYGTELDLQLRRRAVRTMVLGGIATNFGVESTARDAYERAYALVFAEDAMSSVRADAHEFAVKTIFPRIGRVRSTADVLNALA
jgi:nicotinamidase-related amidase